MTPLAMLLRSLDALLDAEDVPGVEEAEREIWEYLSGFDGLTEQTQAINDFAEAFDTRSKNSPLHAMICKQIAQHKRRLTGA